MSKENILSKNKCVGAYVYNHTQVDKSMDEYAEQKAIGFAEWILENGWYKLQPSDLYWQNTDEGTIKKSIKQLFNLYKERK